jgi:hypothetical protein
MMEDAVKSTGHEDDFVIRELIELVAECMDFEDAVEAPEPEDKPAEGSEAA